jgi:hypothetical protein
LQLESKSFVAAATTAYKTAFDVAASSISQVADSILSISETEFGPTSKCDQNEVVCKINTLEVHTKNYLMLEKDKLNG